MDKLGAGQFAILLGGNGLAARYQERIALLYSENYDSFIKLLYKDLDGLINQFQANPQNRNKKNEDGLTEEFVTNLCTAGYTASHDTSSGGHVDITVRIGVHSWIGEAKKDSKFDEGFKQLCTRYRPASGNFEHNHAGMLLYLCKGPNILKRKKAWEKKLKTLDFESISTYDCKENLNHFYSSHVHDVTGREFIVRHMPVALQFTPTDASARRSKTAQSVKILNEKNEVKTRATKKSISK
ncbi:MAG: hypothetical protein HY254_10250 [Burkholderiales bacterium]|nr:hypothetical protein [Burkholderiales bacterium]